MGTASVLLRKPVQSLSTLNGSILAGDVIQEEEDTLVSHNDLLCVLAGREWTLSGQVIGGLLECQDHSGVVFRVGCSVLVDAFGERQAAEG